MAQAATDKSATANAPKQAARKAKSVRRKVSHAAQDATAKVSEVAADAADTVTETVSNALGKQTENISGFGQRQARNIILNAGRALESASSQLRHDGMGDTAEYIQDAADKLLDTAVSIDDFDPSTARSKAETFIQERPMVTLGGLALLGFAAATIMAKRNK